MHLRLLRKLTCERFGENSPLRKRASGFNRRESDTVA
jgi:hypothetical protein